MNKEKYIFPAIFEVAEEGGYCITFPDLPGCITEGDSLDESMYMAKDALELFLWNMEDDNEDIPEATKPENLEVAKGQFIVPITVYMNDVRNEMKNKATKKTLTIPYWLNKLAEGEKLNFSQILQTALKERLNIRE
ncbi:type II toxin-antitoxin system HicB family antitoxin [Clostridium intestinale]|jgi:predicted RNase H-like HicB family nuclease|uniref:type II toxin-antitoxin system HicB family antitoxin n=1 Tax=Clostridium intestinale TaxID=36845 RepID=UPI002DD636A0|nr:type II toxin-antitoxin system HicB family antitoxin [Clostridium intestinale]WRY53910.1 type II toxin-antitoxin system HicB family antitoxin [Clostridium intestinale]